MFRNNENGPEIKYPSDPPVINLISDSDSEPEDNVPVLPKQQVFQWEKGVTSRFVDGRAPLHLPARVAGIVLLNGMTTLNVSVLQTELTAECEIFPQTRSKNEAYLMMGWYVLCKDSNLSTGNTPNRNCSCVSCAAIRNPLCLNSSCFVYGYLVNKLLSHPTIKLVIHTFMYQIL